MMPVGLRVDALSVDDGSLPPASEFIGWVQQLAAEHFRRKREVPQMFLVFATRPQARVLIVQPQGSGPSARETAWIAPAVRHLAAEVGARAIFMAGEAWRSSNDAFSARQGSEPRLDPQRKEGVLVNAENPNTTPVLQSFWAEIIRSKGRPHLGPWQTARFVEGRLGYLLPPEAYGRVGSA